MNEEWMVFPELRGPCPRGEGNREVVTHSSFYVMETGKDY